MQKTWLHIHPSLKEGFGLTVLEAAMCGTPTVCFNISGLKDLITEKTGIIVQRETAQDLSSAIEKIFNNKKMLQQLSKNVLTWSKTFPTWKEQTRNLETLLKQLIKS